MINTSGQGTPGRALATELSAIAFALIVNEHHLRELLAEYLRHYNSARRLFHGSPLRLRIGHYLEGRATPYLG